MSFEERLQILSRLIQEAGSTVFFGGAGVSTASGVPDFRSANGLYTRHLRAEEILTPRFLNRDPEAFYRFYRPYFMRTDIKPNICHEVLARLEKQKLLDAVITQNVDQLHQEAGSQRVLELHGNAGRFYCRGCRNLYPLQAVLELASVPRCPHCGDLLRPDIVLYEESLPAATLNEAVERLATADLILVGGTSLTVYPAAALLQVRKKTAKLVLINQSETPSDQAASLLFREPLADVFEGLVKQLSL